MKLSDRKKQQIILGAVEEFHKNGFSGTSMDAVAQTAGVSKRTVYNHFPSKDELFIGIIQYMFSLIAATLPQPYDSKRDFVEQLREMARQKIELMVSDEFVRLTRVVMPVAFHDPEKVQKAMSQMTSIESDMTNWFQQAIDDKQIADVAASEVCSTFMGLVKMDAYWPRLLHGKPVPSQTEIDKLVDKAVDMFVRYYMKK